MKESEADIFRTEFLGNNTYLLELTAEEIAREVFPGQFVQVRTSRSTDPFLRRTVSVFGADRLHGRIQLLVEIVGPGTEMLCTLNCGSNLNIIGPLGNSFNMAMAEKRPVWLVAGGIGAAPLIFLANELHQAGVPEVTFFMGARQTRGLMGIERFLQGDTALEISTEDGSAGYHGFIIGLVEQRLREESPAVIYACGPAGLLEKVAEFAVHAGCHAQVSLEERMACGLGACYGCAVTLKNGRMARVCHDGPVFESGAIAWR